jgi:MFS family permease
MTRTQRFTITATSLGLLMIYMDALIVNVALPAIQSDFKVGESGLQWAVTAYSLGMTIAIMSSGDRGGHLRPPEALPCRHRSLHGGFRELRQGVLARSAYHRARGPRGRCGDSQRNLARAR